MVSASEGQHFCMGKAFSYVSEVLCEADIQKWDSAVASWQVEKQGHLEGRVFCLHLEDNAESLTHSYPRAGQM